jgi:hypothetical protein
MGLDQYAYARPPRKRNSDNDIQVASGENTIACKVGWKTFGKAKVAQTQMKMVI